MLSANELWCIFSVSFNLCSNNAKIFALDFEQILWCDIDFYICTIEKQNDNMVHGSGYLCGTFMCCPGGAMGYVAGISKSTHHNRRV